MEDIFKVLLYSGVNVDKPRYIQAQPTNTYASKFGLSECAEKHVFGSFNPNNSEIFMLSFEEIFMGTRDTHTAVLGGGVHGMVCWLITYMSGHKTVSVQSMVEMSQIPVHEMHYSISTSLKELIRKEVSVNM